MKKAILIIALIFCCLMIVIIGVVVGIYLLAQQNSPESLYTKANLSLKDLRSADLEITQDFEMVATKSTGEETTFSNQSVSKLVLDITQKAYTFSDITTADGTAGEEISIKFFDNKLYYKSGAALTTYELVAKANAKTYSLTDKYYDISKVAISYNLFPFATDSTYTYKETTVNGEKAYIYNITLSKSDSDARIKDLEDGLADTFVGTEYTLDVTAVGYTMTVLQKDGSIKDLTMIYSLSLTLASGRITIENALLSESFNSINLPVTINKTVK